MYKSPIHIDYLTSISESISEEVDKGILAKVQTIVDIDKEELIKAIAYDRNQYEKGYKEGFKEALEKITIESRPKGKWIIKRDCEEVIVTCSNCGAKDYIPTTIDDRFYFNSNYCWDCGADMRGKE